MRILLAHELFPPDVAGGGEKLVLRLAGILKDEGHDVRVVTSGNPALKSYDGIETTRIPANRYLMNVLAFPALLKQAAWADVVVASSGNMALPAYAAARIARRPVALWIHHVFGEYWRDIRGPLMGRLFELIERLAMTRGFDAYVFQNESSKRIGIAMGVNPKNVRMITPGVDSKFFSPSASVKRDCGVLFVGSIVMDEPAIRTKGLEYVLDAARLLPDVQFGMLGKFDRAIESPANVTWLGSVDRKGLVAAYRRAGMIVCASLNEGFGLALLEAMACGCPIVSTVDIGQVGPKVLPKDVRALADAIRGYADDPKRAAADGRKNVSLARRHTWRKFYSDFEKLYEGLNKHRSK